MLHLKIFQASRRTNCEPTIGLFRSSNVRPQSGSLACNAEGFINFPTPSGRPIGELVDSWPQITVRDLSSHVLTKLGNFLALSKIFCVIRARLSRGNHDPVFDPPPSRRHAPDLELCWNCARSLAETNRQGP
jgi:hypothetical protein